MNSLTKLGQHTLTYGLSTILGRILNYLFVPFYTTLLLPAEYGIITELYAYIAFLNVIYSYGIEVAYFRWSSLTDSTTAFQQASFLLLVSTATWSIIFLHVIKLITHALSYQGHEKYLYYLIGIVSLDTMLVIPFAHLRFNQQIWRFTGLKLLQISLQICLNGLYLYILPKLYNHVVYENSQLLLDFLGFFYDPTKGPITYVLLANLIGNAAVIPFLDLSPLRNRFKIEWTTIQQMLVYSLPLLGMNLAGVVNEMLSRALLRHLLPNGTVEIDREAILGSFGACYKLAILMSLAIQAFRYAAEPILFKQAQNQSNKDLLPSIMHAYILIGSFICYSLAVNLELLGFLFYVKQLTVIVWK